MNSKIVYLDDAPAEGAQALYGPAEQLGLPAIVLDQDAQTALSCKVLQPCQPVFQAPGEWHAQLKSLCQAIGLEATFEDLPPAESGRRLTEWGTETVADYRRVVAYGNDFFHSLAFHEKVLTVDLPLDQPFTAEAARLIQALGFSLAGLLPVAYEGGLLRLQRGRPVPAGEQLLHQLMGQHRVQAEAVALEYHRHLVQAARGQYTPPEELAPSTPEEVTQAWHEQLLNKKLELDTVRRWSERYWRHRILGALRPVLLTAEQLEQWRQASERVGQGLQRAVESLTQDADLRRHIMGSEEAVQADPPLLSRLDGAQTPEGIRFFEMNVGVVGISDVDMATAIYASLGLGQGLACTPSPVFPNLVALLERLHRQRCPEDHRLCLAIPFAPEYEAEFSASLLSFVGAFRALGWDARFCPLHSLRFEQGRLLMEDGQVVHLVARAYFPGAPGSQVVEEAVAHNAALLVNRDAPHGNKGLFELVDDPAIPWTRIVSSRQTQDPDGARVELAEYALQQQNHLVLKPSDGFGGRDVLLGWKTSSEDWARAIGQAIEEYPAGRRSIVQWGSSMPSAQFVDRELNNQEMYWDVNSFLFQGKFGGLAARLSLTAVTNICQGGGAVPVYQLGK